MGEAFDAHKQERFVRFLQSVGRQNDPIMMLLRTHLYAEAVLVDLIRHQLPNGEVVNKKARLQYHQKLLLVEALDILVPAHVASLKALNTVRNEFAHEIDKELTFDDVERIGSPLGETFEGHKQQGGSDTVETLKILLGYLCGRLDGRLHSLKNSSKSLRITKKKSP